MWFNLIESNYVLFTYGWDSKVTERVSFHGLYKFFLKEGTLPLFYLFGCGEGSWVRFGKTSGERFS